MSEIALLNGQSFTKEELQVFDNQYLQVFQSLSDVTKQLKALEKQEKAIREGLKKAMEKYGIKSLENEYIKITHVDANAGKKSIDIDELSKKEPKLYQDLLKDYPKTSIDVDELKKQEPELYADIITDYPKVTGAKAAYLLFKVK